MSDFTSEKTALGSRITEFANAIKAYSLTPVIGTRESEFLAVVNKRKEDLVGSGFIEWGKEHSLMERVNSGISCYNTSTYINSIATLGYGGDSGDLSYLDGLSTSNLPVINVEGIRHTLKATNFNSEERNKILLPSAPDGTKTYDSATEVVTTHASTALAFAAETTTNKVIISRQDLIFLESWHEKIVDKDIVYPLGNVQYGVSTWNGVTLLNTIVAQSYSAFGNWDNTTKGYGVVWSTLSNGDRNKFLSDPSNNIYLSEEGDLIQVRYRIRVLEGLGNDWSEIDTTSQYYRYGISPTSNVIVPKGKNLTSTEYGTWGNHERYAHIGTDIAISKNVSIGSFIAESTGGNQSSKAYKGLCFALPIALVQRRNQGSYHPVLNAYGTSSFWNVSGAAGGYNWYRDEAKTPSTTKDCFDDVGSNTAGDVSPFSIPAWGNITSTISGRPDGKFYDAIYASDVKDLRMDAKPVKDLDRALLREFSKVVAGEQRGFEGTPTTEFLSTHTETRSNYSFSQGDIVTYTYFIDNGSPTDIEEGDFFIAMRGSVVEALVEFKGSTPYAYRDSSRTLNASYDWYKVSSNKNTGHKSETVLHCDIIGDPANYPASWLTEGIPGNTLVIDPWGNTQIPQGSPWNYYLNRKVINIKQALFTTDSGATWSDSTTTWVNGLNSDTNSLSSAIAAGTVIMVFYETKANPTELSNNSEVLKLGSAMASAYSGIAAAISDLIDKVPTGNSPEPQSLWGIEVSQYFNITWDNNKLHKNPTFKPTHDTINLGPTGPAAKILPYLTRENGKLFLQMVYKEMKYDVTWGDDSRFNIVDDQSTITDDNGNSVLVGQKRIALPFFIEDGE